jgi:DNA-binding transcriptional LysR family regulator
MELRHLRYFVAVSETLHFGQAAAKLQIAQPSLSHQIRQLEGDLQTTLLRRTKRRVELTEAGRVFLEQARDILARTDQAAVLARRASHGEAGTLRVAVGCCMNQLEVGKVVSLFNRQHHSIRIELRTMPVPAQFDALQHARLDIGFVRPPIPEPVVTGEIVATEPLMVAVRNDHRLRGRQSVPLSSFADDPFILPAREAVPVYHDIVVKACRESGFVPNAPYEADQLLMVLSMVAAGSGVALVPAFARTMKAPRVVLVPLRAPVPSVEMAVAWRREETSATLAEFVKIARHTFARTRSRSAS